MNLQPRYTLILGVLLLPFSASALAQIHSLRRRNLLKFLILLLMLPLSYMLHIVRPALTWALSDTQMVKRETPASLMEAIPRLAPSTQDTIRLVRQQFQPTDGLFVADLPEIGYLVLYPMGLPMSQLEIIPHGLQTLDARRKAGQFLRRRSQGLLLANEQTFAGGSSSLARRGASDTRLVQTAAPDEINLPIHWQPTPDCSVVLWRVGSVEGAVLYRYEVINR